MVCKCYHAERNFVGKIGVCWGTKEREACSCGGDESKCDFYEDKRKKATPKPITNADRVRQMTDEGIEDWYWWMHKKMMHYTDSRIFVHDWLKAPAEKEVAE